MPEEIKTAETTETNEPVEKVVDEGVKDAELDKNNEGKTEEQTNEKEFDETDGEEEKKAEADKPKQTPEENAEFARKRREAEKKAEIEKARIDAIIDAVGKNPYTDEPLKDKDDVEIYLIMREVEKSGGDPTNSQDFIKFQRTKQQAEAQKQTETKQKEEWLQKDIVDFRTKHPDLKVDALFEDKHFRNFAKGKVGTVPMAEIYSDYTALLSEFEEKTKSKAARLLANKEATPGSLKGKTAESTEGLYTASELANMSQAEMQKNWEKVEKSYAAFQKT